MDLNRLLSCLVTHNCPRTTLQLVALLGGGYSVTTAMCKKPPTPPGFGGIAVPACAANTRCLLAMAELFRLVPAYEYGLVVVCAQKTVCAQKKRVQCIGHCTPVRLAFKRDAD